MRNKHLVSHGSIVSYKLAVRECSLTKLMGSIKTAFSYTQWCCHVLHESSDPESYQSPKEGRINNHSGYSTVVLAPLLLFHLLIVPVLSFSCVFHCSSFPSHPGQDFYCASTSVPGAYVLWGLHALTLLKRECLTFPLV